MKRYLIAFFLLHFTLGFAAVDVSIKIQDQNHFEGQQLNQKNKLTAELLKETANAFLPQFVEFDNISIDFVSGSRKHFSYSSLPKILFFESYVVQSNFFFKVMLVAMLFPKHYFF